jgi:plastocyanin
MTSVQVRLTSAFGVAVAMALAVGACGGGGDGGGGGSPTAPGTGGGTPITITITASGLEPRDVTISSGQVVRFVNNDNRPHEMLTTPHLMHTDCPPINNVGNLSPGASRDTAALNTVRICGFHDHLNPDDTRFRGQINVGTQEGPAPGYIRP